MPITTCLTLNGVALQAAEFYVSVLADARITRIAHHTPESAAETNQTPDTVLFVLFEAEGSEFMCLNTGPADAFSPATSLMLERDTQDGIDQLWDALTDGGTEMGCGWVTDRYGVAWQITPTGWDDIIAGPDPEGARRAMEAMMTMMKFDIAALQAAYDGDAAPA